MSNAPCYGWVLALIVCICSVYHAPEHVQQPMET